MFYTMMSLLRITILVIFGVATSQNHDVNLQTPYRGMTGKRSVEATTLIPPDPSVEDDGMRLLLTRLETLCVEKLEYLITDTNRRFLSLENQSSEVYSTVNNFGDELGRIDRLENLLVKKLDNLTTEVGRMSQCCSVAATPVVHNSEVLEAKMENLGKIMQELMDATRSLPSDVEAIKRNVSSPINVVTRPSGDLSSNSELNQIFNKGLQEFKDIQTANSTSCPPNLTLNKQYPKNCRQVQQSEKTACGTYIIQPQYAPKPFEVVCDLETRGGGWTVIQRRFDGSQDFYLDWQHYKNGFGNLGGEFWLGLENIHLLTEFEGNELLIELGSFQSQNISASYSDFRIGSEMEGYSLKTVGAYSGDAGDSLTMLAGMKFTTKDKDQDIQLQNCAVYSSGAWWYNYCGNSNLNGKYFYRDGQIYEEYSPATVFWLQFKELTSLKRTKMLVRPKV